MIIGNKIHIGSRRKVILGSKLNLSPEIKAYISGLITPLSYEQVTKLDTFVKTVKTGLGISLLADAFDVMYVLAGETAESSLRNLVRNAHYADAVNSPAWTQFEGFTGNGTSSYINSNYKQSTDKVNAVLDSTSLGIYIRTSQPLNSNSVEIGARTTTSSKCSFFQTSIAGSKVVATINDSTGRPSANVITELRGLFIASRKNASSFDIYQNGIKLENVSSESTALSEFNLFISALNNADSAVGFSIRQASFAFVSKGLTYAESLSLTNAFESYMGSNGKGVIS